MSDRIRFELSVPVATRQDSVDYIACCVSQVRGKAKKLNRTAGTTSKNLLARIDLGPLSPRPSTRVIPSARP